MRKSLEKGIWCNMNVIRIGKTLVDSLGFNLAEEVTKFSQAVENHRFTENIPAPISHPIVETIVRDFGGNFEIFDDEMVVDKTVKRINRRQFFQALAKNEVIEKTEALAALRVGTIPASIQSMIDNLENEDKKFEAEMYFSGTMEFERTHELILNLTRELNLDGDQLFELANSF